MPLGPFAVPLSSVYGVKVHANDLNPVSYKYLLENQVLNKCGDYLKAYNLDGRAFVRKLEEESIVYHHAIMNLPAIAVEFLDVFRGWKPPISNSSHLPIIHVHCFIKFQTVEDMENTALKRCENALGCPLNRQRDLIKIHIVRDVAPNKNMLCVSFKLPEEVKYLARIKVEEINNDHARTKKPRLN